MVNGWGTKGWKNLLDFTKMDLNMEKEAIRIK